MNCRKTNWAERGFTLVELAAVMAILVLLAGILVPVITNEMEKSKESRARADAKEIGAAFSRYWTDTGVWPQNSNTLTVPTGQVNLQNFVCIYRNNHNRQKWKGPYLNGGTSNGTDMVIARISGTNRTGMLDPWGRYYILHQFAKGYSGSEGALVIQCVGPDGTSNTITADLFSGNSTGDDIVYVVTRRL